MMDNVGGRVSADRWRPSLGAWPDERGGFRFRVWAPERRTVDLVFSADGQPAGRVALDRQDDGTFTTVLAEVGPGARYAYLLDDTGPFPDPVSRWQPDGVHGWSATVDPRAYRWSDDVWQGVSLGRAVFYELHVGAFSPEGTFAGVIDRLSHVVDLGVTVIELMPVADFPGERNWGYDGVSLFAPARVYGTPDDLRRLVDAAHDRDLAVVLDVVYNHFGPDGAYGFAFSPYYASTRHVSPWGAAVNVDGDHSAHVRAFLIENALHWLHEYHLDGLRLDATHAIVDDSSPHVVAELASRVRESLPGRVTLLVAEDDRNLADIVRPTATGGWGLDAVWADDFHHIARRITAGDRDGYYQDYSDDTRDLATAVRRGWFYVGQPSGYLGRPRGSDPSGVPVEHMVTCLQNHDQIGNRAFGERLHHQVEPWVFRALTAVLLCAPETPLLFMGQEWAASTPFLYFTDHKPELGRLVTDGRRNEFSRFAAFQHEATRSRIPDPQDAGTFEASRLIWTERNAPGHAATLLFHRTLLNLRRSDAALAWPSTCDVAAPDVDTVVIRRRAAGAGILVAARLRGAGRVDLEPWAATPADAWTVILTTEDAPYCESREPDPMPPLVDVGPGGWSVQFARPSAVILRTS